MRRVRSHLIQITAIIILIIICPNLFAEESLLGRGISELRSRNYDKSVQIFSAILSDSTLADQYADALYWLIKTRIAMEDYENASELLNRFLTNYSENKRISEMRYHKARLHYLLGDPEKALIELGKFIEFTPGGELFVSALYWTGEALISLGRLTEAKKVFSHIVSTYTESIKYIPSEYRMREIGYLEREQVLLDLLRWSYEEHMQDMESFYIQLDALSSSESGNSDLVTEEGKEIYDREKSDRQLSNRQAELRARLEELRNKLKTIKSTSDFEEKRFWNKVEFNEQEE